MSKLFSAASHLNKRPIKFQFAMIIHSVEINTPIDSKKEFTVKWECGRHIVETYPTSNVAGCKKFSLFQWGPTKPLMMVATIYKDNKGKFGYKRGTVSVRGNLKGKFTTIGRLRFDTSKFVQDKDGPFQKKITQKLEKCRKKATISLTIFSRHYQKQDGTKGHVVDNDQGNIGYENSYTLSSFESPEPSVVGGDQFWDDLNEDNSSKTNTSYLSPSEPSYSRRVSGNSQNENNYDAIQRALEMSDMPQPRRVLLYTYHYTFTGAQLEEWLTTKGYSLTVEDSIKIGSVLLKENIIQNTSLATATEFINDTTLYTLSHIPGEEKNNLPRLDIVEVLKVKEYNSILKNFLEQKKALIPYLFLEAVQGFINTSLDGREKIADAIIAQYLNPTSPMKISFDPEVLEDIKAQKGSKTNDDYFEKPQKAVIESMTYILSLLRNAGEYDQMIAIQTLDKGRFQSIGPNHRPSVYTRPPKSSVGIRNDDSQPQFESTLTDDEIFSQLPTHSRRHTKWVAKSPTSVVGNVRSPGHSPRNRKRTQKNNKTSHFFPNLSYAQALTQVENGLKAMGHLINVGKDICKKSDAYANGLNKAKLIGHKKEDGIEGAHKIHREMELSVELISSEHFQFSASLDEMLKCMIEFRDTQYKKMKEINRRNHQQKSILSGAQRKAEKEAKMCHRLLGDTRQARKKEIRELEMRENTPTRSRRGVKSSFFTAKGSAYYKDRLLQVAQEYNQSVEKANQLRSDYYNIDLKHNLKQFAIMEQERIEQTKVFIKTYVAVQQSRLDATDKHFFENLTTAVNQFDISEEIKTFVKKHTQKGKKDKLFTDLEYELPYTLHDIIDDNLPDEDDNTECTIKPKKNLFCVPLASITDLHPTGEIPMLVPTLIHAVIKHGGCNTLGVFRISAAVEDLELLENQFEAGDYDTNKIVKDPHLPAAMLKQWLRSLPEPIIPLNSYDRCIKFAKENSEASLDPEHFEDSGLTQSIKKIIDEFPRMNYLILIQLAILAKKISINVEENKMSMENIAIVFAPTLMRNPVMDAMAMFANTHSETTFIKILFSILAEGNEQICIIESSTKEKLPDDSSSPDAIYDSVLAQSRPRDISREVSFSNLEEEEDEKVTEKGSISPIKETENESSDDSSDADG